MRAKMNSAPVVTPRACSNIVGADSVSLLSNAARRAAFFVSNLNFL